MWLGGVTTPQIQRYWLHVHGTKASISTTPQTSWWVKFNTHWPHMLRSAHMHTSHKAETEALQ